MIIYIVCFIFLAILALQYDFEPFESKFTLITIIVLLTLLAGLRGIDVDKDYFNYQLSFDLIYDIVDDPAYLTVYEPGFLATVLIIRQFFEYDYGMIIMLCVAVSSIILKVKSIRHFAINPYLVILFYFSHYFILQEMTEIRVGIASAIFLVSLRFYLKSNYMAFVAFILLAVSFHYSAIIFLLVFLFNTVDFSRYTYSLLLALSILFAFIKPPLTNIIGYFDVGLVSRKLASYSGLVERGVAESINVFNVVNICNMLCCLYLMFCVPKPILTSDRRLILFLKCNFLSIFLLSLLSGVPSIAFRISELFGIVSMFSFAYLAKYLPAFRFNTLLLVLLAGLFFYINVFYGELLGPYKIIKIKSDYFYTSYKKARPNLGLASLSAPYSI